MLVVEKVSNHLRMLGNVSPSPGRFAHQALSTLKSSSRGLARFRAAHFGVSQFGADFCANAAMGAESQPVALWLGQEDEPTSGPTADLFGTFQLASTAERSFRRCWATTVGHLGMSKFSNDALKP
jgi:hypothetical protein